MTAAEPVERRQRIRERGPTTANEASFRLWVSFILVLLSFGAGAMRDRSWHTHHKFNDFYSPPHIFIYTTFGLGALVMLSLALSRERATWFGPAMKLPRVGIEAPAPLLLALAGFGTVMLGGFLDLLSHNTFGLDETELVDAALDHRLGRGTDLGRLSVGAAGAGEAHRDLDGRSFSSPAC